MSSCCGENLRLSLFGESHSRAVGMTIEGLPAGFEVDGEKLRVFLERRRPGVRPETSQRNESDEPEFLCGLKDGKLTGSPLTAVIGNEDAQRADYARTGTVPRPGHADYTAYVKYEEAADLSGGGHFSGRLTAPLCVAGGICLQILEKKNVRFLSRLSSVGEIEDEGELTDEILSRPFPALSPEKGEAMRQRILAAREAGDSVGGVVEIAVLGLPAGLGDPIFDGMESRLARVLFGIPAVKGVEFGDGFASARRSGSENNDAFVLKDGKIATETNRCGGILGGITDGMPLTLRVAFKPTPSVAVPQRSVDLSEMREVTVETPGRHDPCVALRAMPAVEAACAIAVLDAFLGRRKETGWN